MAQRDTTIARIAGLAAPFRDLLAESGVTFSQHCHVLRVLAQLEVLTASISDEPPDAATLRAVYPRFLPVYAACSLALRAAKTPSWPEVRKKLHFLGKGVPPTAPTERRNAGRDGALEFLTACAVASFATDVRYGQVDVLFSHAGRAWGIECKTVAPTSGREQVIDDLRKSRSQVEGGSDRHEFERGIGLVNMTDKLRHAEIYDGHLGSSAVIAEEARLEATRLVREHAARKPLPEHSALRAFVFVHWYIRGSESTNATFQHTMQFARRDDHDAADDEVEARIGRCFEFPSA